MAGAIVRARAAVARSADVSVEALALASLTVAHPGIRALHVVHVIPHAAALAPRLSVRARHLRAVGTRPVDLIVCVVQKTE